MDEPPIADLSPISPTSPKDDWPAFWLAYTANLTPGALDCIIRQDALLTFYAKCGNLSEAARLAGINHSTPFDWHEKDTHHFRLRLSAAKAEFSDFLEKLGMERLTNPTGNRGSDLLLLAYLNAHRPEKWRPNAQPVNDVAKDLLKALMQAAQDGHRRVKISRTDTVEVEDGDEKPA